MKRRLREPALPEMKISLAGEQASAQ